MVDESKTVDLFKIWTNEVAINHDDLVKQPISVNFDFVLPEMFSGVIEGDPFGEKSGLWGFLQKGKVEWNSPSIFSFGNGGQLEVSLSDEAFNEGWFWGTKPGRKYGAIVEATFILKQESKPEAPPEKVPEPSSILGLSVLCFGVLRKKQLSKTA